ncbi:uncharacterized protein G2W53_016570 [Senna tora]|uniref:Uncharacterized protein n=1 Tax=Senna tora TaxID=362788 RepID=A0A834TR50_9FABA|nr:uncharacterized protein G2W53_016570 [Senna tora]
MDETLKGSVYVQHINEESLSRIRGLPLLSLTVKSSACDFLAHRAPCLLPSLSLSSNAIDASPFRRNTKLIPSPIPPLCRALKVLLPHEPPLRAAILVSIILRSDLVHAALKNFWGEIRSPGSSSLGLCQPSFRRISLPCCSITQRTQVCFFVLFLIPEEI